MLGLSIFWLNYNYVNMSENVNIIVDTEILNNACLEYYFETAFY